MTRQHPFLILCIIILVGTLTQISTDMYTPSLPAIALSFKTSLGEAQLTMTWLIFGVGITSLLYGPLSEGIGRRWTIMIGTGIAILGTILCASAHSIEMLQIGRLIQGLGLGAAASLWRSIFRDTYSGEDMARVSSYLINAIIFSVIAAPFLGGYIQKYLGWRASFIVLFFWSLIVLLVILLLFKETSQHHGKHRLNIKFVLQSYGELLRSRVFIGMGLSVLLTFGGLFSWITAGPVILIHGAKISPVLFGYLTIFIGAAYAVAGNINGKVAKKIGSNKMMYIGWLLMTIAGVLVVVGKWLVGINVYAVLIPALVFIIGSTFIFANAVGIAFAPFGHIAGYAGSLYSTIQLIGGVIFTALLSHFNTSSQTPMGWMFIASGILAYLVFVIIVKSKNSN